MTKLAGWAAWLIWGYQQALSPLLPPSCRFEPSCSEYARQALLGHGLVRGLWLALRRLARCHPLYSGGYDPPPVATGGRGTAGITAIWKNERSWPPS